MISIDTETTGLWWEHDTIAFAVGVYTEEEEYHERIYPIDPYTRQLEDPPPEEDIQWLQSLLWEEDYIVFQNANFDLKALCKWGVFSIEEPCDPSFWDNIIELSHLSHLYDSTDAEYKSSLKQLAPKYLGVSYHSEEELNRLVNRCRTFIANRDPYWLIASSSSVPQAKDPNWKMDMWLPAALLKEWPDQWEVKEYFKDDYHLLNNIVSPYLKADCTYTLNLAQAFLTELLKRHTEEEFNRYYQMNHEIFPVIWEIETKGVGIHPQKLERAIDACESLTQSYLDICETISGTPGPYTDAQLREIIYEGYGVEPIAWTDKTKLPSAKTDVLKKLKEDYETPKEASRFISYYQAVAKIEKKKQTLESWKRIRKNRKIYTSLKATGTGTTRLSSQNPNTQNIEKTPEKDDNIDPLLQKAPSLRSIFGPPKGYWWFAADYSQLQLRIFAWATKDPGLKKAFQDGKDFHDFMARTAFSIPSSREPTAIERRTAKAINFGFIFGSSERKIDTVSGRQGLYAYLMESFPGAHEFINSTKEKIKDTGIVHTMGGYPLQIPLTPNPWTGGMSYAAHKGVNYIIQGTEGEIIKRAMRQCYDYLKQEYPKGRIVLQVHDELVFQMPSKPPKRHLIALKNLMEESGSYFGVETPVDFELCRFNYSQKEKVSL